MGGRIKGAEKEIKIDTSKQSREKQAKSLRSSNNRGRLQDVEARTGL
jgi:hypothetical protein